MVCNNTSQITHSYKIVTFLTVMPRGVVLGAKGSTHSPLRVETNACIAAWDVVLRIIK
jgi:hypothetical protein